MIDKSTTIRACENTMYLCEKKGIKHLRTIEMALNLSRGYLLRCLNHDNKRLSVDIAMDISNFFGVSLSDLLTIDLRSYDNMLKASYEELKDEEEDEE